MLDPIAGEKVLGALSDEERQNYYTLLQEEGLRKEPALKVPTFLDKKREIYETLNKAAGRQKSFVLLPTIFLLP